MPIPSVSQLPLSPLDRERLVKRLDDCYAQWSSDLERRTNFFARLYRLWRNGMGTNGFPEEDRSNFSIPLIPWNVKAKLAKEMDVLLGEESEIVVAPIGQSDVARAEKAQRWMNWRVKNSLKLFRTLYVHLLQKRIFGISILFVPWVTRKRIVKKTVVKQVPVMQQVLDKISGLFGQVPAMQPQTEEIEQEVIDFDGPDPRVEDIEDWFFPQTNSDILEGDFLRRIYVSIEEVLDLRDQGKLDAAYVAEKLEELRHLADTNTSMPEGDVSDEKAVQAGAPTQPIAPGGKLVLHNWFGKIRLNVDESGKGGDERATDIVAFYQPQRKCLLGVCRLIDIFPDGRTHFIASKATLDVNSPWGIGDAELLEPISQEMDAFHRLAVSAGEGSIGPVIFYEPSSGFDPEKHKIEPMTAIPTANARGVQIVNLGQIQLAPYVSFIQELQSFAERLTSLTDPQLGRQFSMPNAPRTLGQQQLLQAESNVNLLLDIRLERESLRELLHLIWDMDRAFLPKPYFFRVTESDPGDVMTDEDMMGSYDFDIGPVTAISNRAQKTQELMQAFALVQPMMIPQLTVALLKKVLVKLGQQDVAAILPDVSKLMPPVPPEQENARLLQGEALDPNPLDNHPQHIAAHSMLLQQLQQEVAPGISMVTMNPSAPQRIQLHIEKHLQLIQQQMMMQQMLQGQVASQQPGGGSDGPTASQKTQSNGPPRQPSPVESSQNMTAGLLNGGGVNLA